MKSVCNTAIAVFILLATTGNVWGDTYRVYHTMDNTVRFRVRMRNIDTDLVYTSNYLVFKGRPWIVNLPDGKYQISRTYGRSWKKIDTYRIGDAEFAEPGQEDKIYIGTNQSFWRIDDNGRWSTGQGAPPVRMEIAHGLRRIPYFGIRGEAYQNPPGVLVTFVERGSAATKLKRNGEDYYLESKIDVITDVNGKPVRNFKELKKMIEDSQGFMKFKAYDLRRKATLEYVADF